MSYDVFISHSSVDKHVADAVCARLEAKRIRCWIAPRDIGPGKLWAEAINEGISNSRILLLILSNNSNSSSQVTREVDLAAKNGLTIVPFRIEDTSLSKSLEYYISNIHWLDAISEPREKEINILVDYIHGILINDRRYTAEREGVETVNFAPESALKSKKIPVWAWGLGVLIIAVVITGFFAMNRKPAESPKTAQSALSTGSAASAQTPSNVSTLIFDGGKDTFDILKSKLGKGTGGSPGKEDVVAKIPQASLIILLDYPGTRARLPEAEQLFSGMTREDANYLNAKVKDGKLLVLIHGETKEKLMFILDKVQASDFEGEKYVTY